MKTTFDFRQTEPFVSELCPYCFFENTIEWDVASNGMVAHCCSCGNKLLLCGMCPFDECRNDCPFVKRDTFLDEKDSIRNLTTIHITPRGQKYFINLFVKNTINDTAALMQ